MKSDIESIAKFTPAHSTFVGVDSDGCVFDTMTAKQCGYFHPLIIEHWSLQGIEKQVRAAAEFINLKSRWRGRNRFPALLMTFEMLPGMKGVPESGVRIPETKDLKSYCESGLPLGNCTLEAEVKRTGSRELAQVLKWSLDVNRKISEEMPPASPFPGAVETLRMMSGQSDLAVVSQTPLQTLIREWEHFGIIGIPSIIAAQEAGSKSEHIRLAAKGKYPDSRILLVGDAPGDMEAAHSQNILFYPIIPGREEKSWAELRSFYYDEFLRGNFEKYERRLTDAFLDALPSEFHQ